jgi:phospholipid/cholesterol/gamma-HCH transport system substrate-binding protein
MVTQAPKRSAVAIAIAFTLSCVGLIIFVWTQFGGTIPFAAQGYRIRALFAETGLLVPNADVRISGVNIGKVVSVQARGVDSLVTMDIDEQYSPIPANTQAILREKTLLGEAYIELSTGNRSGPKLPDEGEIPLAQVQPTQQLDQVLAAFNTQTQHNFQATLQGTGNALAGRGQDLNDFFGNSDMAITELAAVADELNAQQTDLKSLINTGATVLTTLGDRGSELSSLVTSGDSVLSATADEDSALTTTVNDFPAFLSQLRTTLTTLNTTLGIAKPSLEALEPVAPLLTPALRDLVALSGPTVQLLREAPAVLRDAETALPAIKQFMVDFKPAVNALLPAAEQIAPVINIVKEFRPELIAGMANLAAILQGQTTADTTQAVGGVPAGQAKYIRSDLTVGSDSIFGQSVRSPGERSNTYQSPGTMNSIASGLPAASCTNTKNTAQFPVATGNVPCKLASTYPWGYGISTSYYPHVTKGAP